MFVGISMKKKKIVIVDDDSSLLEALTTLLEDEGYRVTPYADGTFIEEQVAKDPPDVLLLDIQLPGRDGTEICESLKSKSTTKDIPVVLISANTNTKYLARESGADDFLVKPFGIDDLMKRIKYFTNQKPS